MLDATERKALTLSTFVAGCIAFMPAQILSGIALLVISAALFEYDRVMTRREEAAAEGADPATVGEAPQPPRDEEPPPEAPHLGT